MGAPEELGGNAVSLVPHESRIPGRYIILLKGSVDHPGSTAQAQTDQLGGRVGFIYRYGLKGYSAVLSDQAVGRIERDPRVQSVEPDLWGRVDAQTTPTGISRIFAAGNEEMAINEQDDFRIDADIAIIDSGIALHEDLNVVSRTDCSNVATENHNECLNGSGSDEYSHGTHVAGIAAAIDNGVGVTGVAPGARLWGVKVLDQEGAGTLSEVIAGFSWVSTHTSEIEVVNASLSFKSSPSPALSAVIKGLVAKGVVVTVSAGNQNENAANRIPASDPEALTVSAIADFDGKPGSEAGSSSCREIYEITNPGQVDDQRAVFSNYGSVVDIAAPGACIKSTVPFNGYQEVFAGDVTWSGTSMSAPYVAGAAAILASQENPSSKSGVDAIRERLTKSGNLWWKDTSPDGIQERLLDVGWKNVFYAAAKNGGDGWSIQYTPGGSGVNLYEIACDGSSSSACTAVGKKMSGGLDSALIERWDGGGWSTESAALPSGTTQSRLTGVSCVTTTWCMATGNYQTSSTNATLSERWNGSSWSVTATPNPAESSSSELTKVSCASPNACTAVGSATIGGQKKALIERWNGSSWSIQSFTPPTGSTSSQFDGVACRGTTFCIAVGRYTTASGTEALTATWNGTTWTVQPVVEPAIAVQSVLLDISCSGTTPVCTAVGGWKNANLDQFTFVQYWNGTSWSLQASPDHEHSSANVLQNVSCITESNCTAVGSWVSQAGGGNKTLGLHWNGSKWSIEKTPNTAGATFNALFGVVCRSGPDTCLAVGYRSDASGIPEGFGLNQLQWETQVLPDPPGAETILRKVSCDPTTLNMCVAVGSNEAPVRPVALRWNGKSWGNRLVPVPSGTTYAALSGSSCTSTTSCVAVGNYKTSTVQSVLVEVMSGAEWSVQSAANPSSGSEPHLNGVSCSTSTACTAVGFYLFGKTLPLVERWNGTSWVLQSIPLPVGVSSGILNGVACPTASFCVAVGEAGSQAYAATWNGSVWTVTSLAVPAGAAFSDLKDLSCTSASACTAVGSFSTVELGRQILVQRWNGSTWVNQAAPLPPGAGITSFDSHFEGVSCVSGTSCTAVGRWSNVSGNGHGFAQIWNGTSWQIQKSPTPGPEAGLNGVVCRSSICLGVGYYWNSLATTLPLAQRFEP